MAGFWLDLQLCLMWHFWAGFSGPHMEHGNIESFFQVWFLICISYMRRLMHDIVTLCWPITKSSNGQFDYNRDALVIYYSTDCINMIVWYDYIEDRKYYCKIIQIYNSANYFNIGFIMCHLNKVRKFFPRVYHCSTHFWKEHHQVGLGIGT